MPVISRWNVLTKLLVLVAVLVSAPAAVGSATAQDDGESGAPPPEPCVDADDQFEENDTPATGAWTKLPFAAEGLLACEGDDDWFLITAPAGVKVDIAAAFAHEGGDIDLSLFLDPFVAPAATSTSVTDDEAISLVATDSGIHYLLVDLVDDPDGAGNTYDLNVDIGCPPAVETGGAFRDGLLEPLPIPDAGVGPVSVVNCIEIDDPGTVENLNVGLEATHTWVGDLAMTLEHVDTGTAVTLMDRPGEPAVQFGCDSDDIEAEFSDESAVPVEDACNATAPALSGVLRPDGALAAFDGESIAGVWRLQITDIEPRDVGSLDAWYISSGVETPTPTPSPTATPEPDGLIGDVDCNGVVNSIDAAVLLQYVAQILGSLPCPENADVNEDGDLDAIDATLILQFTAGLLSQLPP